MLECALGSVRAAASLCHRLHKTVISTLPRWICKMSYCQTYNKFVIKGHGTLIGNWLEEEILRDASGHTHLER